ncbi:MAG TPA: hypothetical protein VKQ72_18015 [Aggregatilineales bacterium]|nr:hypothetical protein [Aggregatilineales bacterium]
MPISVEMQEDGYVMFWRIADPWTVKELKEYYPQAKVYLDAATHIVHTLVDLRDAHRVSSDVLSGRHTSTWNHPRSGQMAVIGASGIVKMTLDTVFRLVQFTRIRFFDSERDARTYLRQLIAQEQLQPADKLVR